jgi:PKD repeat protein
VPGPMACQVTTLGPVYPGDPVTFLVTGGLPAYSWSGGDAPPPTNGGPRFTTTWPQSGMKAVQVFDLRGRQASCTADILPRPGIRCTPAHVELLTGSTQAFQASGGGGSYAWSGGDLPEGGGPEATFSSTFRTPGTYLVTVQSPGFDPATCVTLVADPLSCKPHSNTSTIGQPVRFHATGGLATKQWHAVGGNPGSGVTTGSEPFVTVFPVPGIPSVALSSGWQTAACSAIVCGGLRTEVIAKANHIWPGEVATFHALVVGGSPVHTLWEFGDGTSSEGMQATHRFNSPGRYLVQFTAWEAGSGCTATATVTVRVGIEDGSDMEPPQEPPGQGGTAILFLDAGEDQTVLEGTLVRLSARSTPGLVHSWRQVGGPDLQLLRTPEPQWTAPRLASEEPLVYSFVVEASGGGAQLFDDLHVVVLSANRPPIADAGLDVQVAPGATVSLSAGRSMDPDGDTLAFAWVEVTNDGKRLPIGNGANLTWSVPPTRQRHILEVHVSDGRRTVADGLIVDVALAASPEVAPPSHLETPAIASIPAHQAKALWLPLIPGGLAILACAGLVAGLVVAAAKRRYEESTTPGGRRMSASPRGIQDQSTIGIARGSSCAPAKPK